jgi:hypothetical protein
VSASSTVLDRGRTLAWRSAVVGARVVARPTSSARPLPDYLIVGTQRGGTTTLHHWLAAHPGVLPARLTKGVHWFDTAFGRSEAWYRSHFPSRRVRAAAARRLGYEPVVGEGSPYYMFHPFAPARIASVLPDPRLLVVLRDPVERAWSQYHHETARGFEDLPFEAALEAEASRLAGEAARLEDPRATSSDHQHHSYEARGRYAEQIERMWQAVGRDRVLVLFSEDLSADPVGTMTAVHRFLGLPPLAPDTERRWNLRPKPAMPDAARARLEETFRAPDARLAELLGRPVPWASQIVR